MTRNDYYKTLGVSENASEQDIKRAYRELAKKYHPDRDPSSTENEAKFKEISEAYSVLSNKKKRAEYDQMRKYGFGSQGQGRQGQGFNYQDLGSMFSGFGGSSQSGGFDGLGDLFSQFFGQDRRGAGGFSHHRQGMKGQDFTASVTVPFDVAIRGGKQEIVVNGKRLSVKIPAGIENGKTIRLRGQGQSGYQGGAAGDLLLTVNVAPHPTFSRKGADMYSTVKINPIQAMVGSKVRVLTYDQGAVELKIPAGTQPDKYFKLKGQGIELNGNRGDHYVQVQIEIPQITSAHEKEALLEFAKKAGLTT